jgi:hypothetical protein
LLAWIFVTGAAPAQQTEVTFFVIGKHANFSQTSTGDRHPVDYSFFSEIFLADKGEASGAVLTFPTGERVNYTDMRSASGASRDNILLYSGAERFAQLAELQQRYPDGTYHVTFDTPGGPITDAALRFDARRLPRPAVIRVAQGQKGNCVKLVPNVDAIVTWGRFAEGAADENGILDDLVFVILTDADGMRVAHSGRPFSGKPYLTYADSSFTIDGASIVANRDYTLSVEHAILDDTSRPGGIPAFTTRAVTTKLSISAGPQGMSTCVSADSNTASIQPHPGANLG